MLALSSLSKSSRYVGILYAGIIFFTAAVYGALYAITGDSSLSWLSVGSSLTQVVDVDLPAHAALRHSLAGLADRRLGLIAVAFSILERRVRGVEIVT